MRLWRTKRRLLQQIDYWRAKAWRAEHWNEPEQADPDAEPFAWMTYPVELPADTIIEKATISGPPWDLRLTIKNPDRGKAGDPFPLLGNGDTLRIGADGSWVVTRAESKP